jgi:hypothetical protein
MFQVAHAEWSWLRYDFVDGPATSSASPLVVYSIDALSASKCYVVQIFIRGTNTGDKWEEGPVSDFCHTEGGDSNGDGGEVTAVDAVPASPFRGKAIQGTILDSPVRARKHGGSGADVAVDDDASLLASGAIRSDGSSSSSKGRSRTPVRMTTQPITDGDGDEARRRQVCCGWSCC